MKKTIISAFILVSGLVWSCHTDPVSPDDYQLDEQKSVAEWKGYLRTGYFNEGAITVKSDQLKVKDGQVTGGSFTIPVSSIVNFNLPVDSLKHQLVHHLQSPDFFNMALHPNITYVIASVAPYKGSEGIAGATHLVSGELTMLGKSNPVVFPAKIGINNDQLTVDATLKVDRTKWGMAYAADSTLPAEQNILPNMDIHLKLIGKRKQETL
ncbi:YceI family protein [Salmonirosea aquatica]|uniref:YceI family protein n=1 Tax=Salmonirosea aquatica TaxID=2654236 RepID=A0A7C9BF59_9BACT|nr:YceI family protein [Cytophagaceae bacterium SJW1-29]